MQTQYSFQPDFRPDLIAVNACANYATYREELETIDDILRRSGLDEIMVGLALEKRRENIPEDQERVCDLNRFLSHLPETTTSRENYAPESLGTATIP